MPYNKVSELPESVKNALPSHAQEIYKEAFNSAFDEYSSPNKRQGNDTQEETAHKVAWAAVKNIYEKSSTGKWQKKSK